MRCGGKGTSGICNEAIVVAETTLGFVMNAVLDGGCQMWTLWGTWF